MKKILWLVILIILFLIVALSRRALAPQTAEAQVISTPTVQEECLTVSCISERVQKDFSKRMVAVVKCESNFRQFDSDGTVLLSSTLDVGLFQINLKAHLKQSQKMGLDIINSMEDNYTYAKHLYDEQGETPWVCSRLI